MPTTLFTASEEVCVMSWLPWLQVKVISCFGRPVMAVPWHGGIYFSMAQVESVRGCVDRMAAITATSFGVFTN